MHNADAVASKVASWELFATHLQPHLEEMPHLQPFHDRLRALAEEARELAEQQERARKKASELTRRRQAVEKEGDNLRARAAAYLRASFGFTSEHLIPFGIRPRRGGRRGDPAAAPSDK